MADTKLADLTALTTPSGDDILYIVDDPAGTPLDRKIALDNLFTRGTITADAPVLNMSQTWNNGAVTFTGLKFNAATGSNTGSASGSLLMDLQLEGVSQFNVNKTGVITTPIIDGAVIRVSTGVAAVNFLNVSNYSGWSSSRQILGVSEVNASSAGGFSINNDTILTRRAAANLRLGAADAAGSAIAVSSVASNQLTLASNHGLTSGAAVIITGTTAPSGTSLNTLYYARSISAAVIELYLTFDAATATSGTTGIVAVTTAGTSASIRLSTPFQRLSPQDFTGTDIPGQPLLINGSRGTGTGPGGSIIFQVAPAVTTGSVQNALATALTIDSTKNAYFTSRLGFSANNTAREYGYGMLFSSLNTDNAVLLNYNGVLIHYASYFAFSNGDAAASADTILRRDDANKLALRNGNNGQTFRLYGRFTDITNDFERFFIEAPTTSGAAVLLGTQKGATTGAARALAFQTDGTTRLTIATNGDLTIADAENIILGSTTGTKIGTATTQKIGFYNATPVVQPTAVADATDAATVITQLNALLAHMRTLGLIAT